MTVSYKEFNYLKFLLLQARGVYGSNNWAVSQGRELGLVNFLGYYEHETYLTFAEKKKRKVEPKRTKLLQEAVQFSPLTNCIYTCQLEHLGHFSFVRTDWRGHSHRNEDLTFN